MKNTITIPPLSQERHGIRIGRPLAHLQAYGASQYFRMDDFALDAQEDKLTGVLCVSRRPPSLVDLSLHSQALLCTQTQTLTNRGDELRRRQREAPIHLKRAAMLPIDRNG